MQISLTPHQMFILQEALRVAAEVPMAYAPEKVEFEKLGEYLHNEFLNSGEYPTAAAAYGCAPTTWDDEQIEWDVVLQSTTNKIVTIKALREITHNLPLATAVSLVQNMPCAVKYGISKADAEDFKKILEEAGAKVIF